MNSINVIGRLTKDWERVDSGKMLIKSSLAVDLGHDKTMFIDLVSFNERTMDATEKYTAKGSQVGISGMLSSNDYTDKNGNKRTSYSIICNKIDFLGGSNHESTAAPTPNKEYVREEDKGDKGLWD